MHLRDWKWAWQPKYFPVRSVHNLLKPLSKFLNLPLMHHHSIKLQCLLQWHGGLCQSVATPHNVVGLLWLHYPLQCYWKNIGIVYLEPLLKSHLPSLRTKLLIFSSCVNLLNRSTYSSVDDRTCKLHVYTYSHWTVNPWRNAGLVRVNIKCLLIHFCLKWKYSWVSCIGLVLPQLTNAGHI